VRDASSTPRVSLVVPVFNEPVEVIRQSLDSVAAQTFADFECIVVDESTDPLAAVAVRTLCERDGRFRCVHPDTRLGLAASLNLGIGLSRAQLIARFDSDDICQPERLQRQVAFMDAHPEVGVLGGGLELMDESCRTLAFRSYPSDHASIERKLQTTTAIAHPTVMMRKALIEQHGGYDPSFRFAEDLDLWLRLINRGIRFANLPDILVRYRQQHTGRNPRHWEFNLRARKRNFAMRCLPRRLLGLFIFSVWGRLPANLQQRIFHALLLRRGTPSGRSCQT
jgi:glycosyltransferase involved in cell wall biosynthesis